jgi:hypothetical protein
MRKAMNVTDDEPDGSAGPTDEEARLAALLAVLALVRADGEPAGGGADGHGRTGGAALARWRAQRLAALRRRPTCVR